MSTAKNSRDKASEMVRSQTTSTLSVPKSRLSTISKLTPVLEKEDRGFEDSPKRKRDVRLPPVVKPVKARSRMNMGQQKTQVSQIKKMYSSQSSSTINMPEPKIGDKEIRYKEWQVVNSKTKLEK